MRAIKIPPPLALQGAAIGFIANKFPDQLNDYLEWYSACDAKGRYLPYDELRHRVPKKLQPELVWELVKLARRRQYHFALPVGNQARRCPYTLTPSMQRAISLTDRHTTDAALEWMTSKIGEAKQFQYLLNDLVEDEAISSSQLEGAATTTLAAKDMIKRKRKPRTLDEKMIVGNFHMMKAAWELRHQDLSPDLIAQIHATGVDGIDDEQYTPGAFRQNDDVVVEGSDGEIVHRPPEAAGIEQRLGVLCQWVNESHDGANNRDYLHPLLKAVALHFAIGYEHPFRDGNGRVARALFYWFMFKNGFAAFRYIAISLLLKKSVVKYGKSYLFTETDDMDLTYFFEHQCSVVIRAIEEFTQAYEKTFEDQKAFQEFLWRSGLLRKMNDKQITVLQVAQSRAHRDFTAANVKENLGCSYNTANAVLKGLVDLKLFKREKDGKEWIYNLMNADEIRSNWQS